jgi:hypothetical protein
MSELLNEFMGHVTIQGLVYLSSKDISLYGKMFWCISICFMLSIGMFWTVEMYTNWQGQQVV